MATKKIVTKPKKTIQVNPALAVVEFTPHQYLVKEGDVLELEKLSLKEGEKIKADKVLFYSNGDKIQVGTPYLDKVVVEMEHLDTKKAPKIKVVKFKAKSRYRRAHGHRQSYSYLKVISIK